MMTFKLTLVLRSWIGLVVCFGMTALGLLGFNNLAWGQLRYPPDYFRSPLDIPLQLSGSFGELRMDHFHSGIDFKTQGREGFKVYAVAEGYISRIRVSPFGYGNALYITHPNGYVSVYAHLQRFSTTIDEFVRQKQKSLQVFEVDLVLTPQDLVGVAKGEVIGLSGNTGGSGGPHLHFEIRSEKTEHVINPHFFGYKAFDTVKPLIASLMIYPYKGQGSVNGNRKPQQFRVVGSNGNYSLGNIVPQVKGDVYVGLQTWDSHNGSNAHNGVFSITMRVNGKTTFSFKMDHFSFDDTRCANSMMDYARRLQYKNIIYKCFKEPNCEIDVYDTLENNGLIRIPLAEKGDVEIVVKDFNQNTSRLRFQLVGSDREGEQVQAAATTGVEKFLKSDRENEYEGQEARCFFPKGCLFDDLTFRYYYVQNYGTPISYLHKIHNLYIPLRRSYSLAIKAKPLVDSLKSKVLMVRTNDKGERVPHMGKWLEEDFYQANVRNFGEFVLDVDTIAPTIWKVTKGERFFAGQRLAFRIKDDLSGISDYRVFLDGSWIFYKYDAKNERLEVELPNTLSVGAHELNVFVTDAVSNQRRLTIPFEILQ